MSGHRVTIQTAGAVTGAAAHPGAVPLWLAVPLTIPPAA